MAMDKEREALVPEYRQYQRKQIAEMADWHPGFDMTGVSVSDADRQAGSPKIGDKIARNPKNHADKWLVAADYFADNFAALSAPQQEPVAHPDDAAIDKFAAAMKAKMAKKRAEGRSGWDDPEQCTIDYLTRLFHDHVRKGDPVDIGNFAMMLWNRISATSLPAQYRRIPAPQPDGVVVPRDLFDELEWGSWRFDNGGDFQNTCPVCGNEKGSGHQQDCRIAVLLAAAKEQKS